MLGGFAGLLLIVVALAGVGVGFDMPVLWALALVVLAVLIGLVGKVLTAVAVYLGGTTKRLKVLNDRYDDTEIWLEQFDKGTRATLTNMSASMRAAKGQSEALATRFDTAFAKAEGRATKLEETIAKLATREALDAAVKAAGAASTELAGALANTKSETEKLTRELGKRIDTGATELSRTLEQLRETSSKLEASTATALKGIESLKQSLGERIDALSRQQESAAKVTSEQTRKELIESASRLEAVNAGLTLAASQASRLRNEGYAQFTRQIGDEYVAAVQGAMGASLGLKIATRELRYLERKVQQIEAVCEGRLATTAEDAITRVLAARSLKADELRVLEIGVLFGVGAAFMHTALAPFYKRVHLVLLDPFDGYYGTDHLDPLTGQKVTRAAVERNLTRASIPPQDATILEGFSTDDAVLDSARQSGPYDVIVIDGDHSYEGVQSDFQRYADLVRPGGILIVDDYGSKDWPEVTRFVDSVVNADERFERLGIYSRTALFKRHAAESQRPTSQDKSKTPKVVEKAAPTAQKSAKPSRASTDGPKKSPTPKTQKAAEPEKAGPAPKPEVPAEPVVVRSKGSRKATSAKSGSGA